MSAIKSNKLVALLRGTIAAGLLTAFLIHAASAQPVISPPTWGADPLHAQVMLSNCTDPNVQYVIQMSTNLTDWQSIKTHASSPTYFYVIVPTTSQICFYRVMALPPLSLPISSFGILCKSNFAVNGNLCSFDSFDSSNLAYSTGGYYDATKRKANVSIATDSTITNALFIGNCDIYGSIYTGVGTMENAVAIGSLGSVGDLAWVSNGNTGIEPGHWIGNLNVNIPDVAAPNTTGWIKTLPPAVSGWITLNGGYYVVSAINYPLVITAPTTLWVKGSLALGVTITNTGQLILYAGNTNGAASTLSWNGYGNFNVLGLATNLQIYGLPSLTSINFSGNAAWTGVVYAPEAAFTAGGGGNNLQDVSGAIVAQSVLVRGHFNFHYDENLAAVGRPY